MLRILYVEDNAANLSLVHRVARVGGHEVVNRTSGEAALKDFASIKPDLVLMDIQLEGAMSGLDVVRKLRADGYADVPIVAVTAYAMKGDKEKALDAGCDSYLSKPLPIDKLVALINKYQAEMDARKTSEIPKVAIPAAMSEAEANPMDGAADVSVEAASDADTKIEAPETESTSPSVVAIGAADNDKAIADKTGEVEAGSTDVKSAETPTSDVVAGKVEAPTQATSVDSTKQKKVDNVVNIEKASEPTPALEGNKAPSAEPTIPTLESSASSEDSQGSRQNTEI